MLAFTERRLLYILVPWFNLYMHSVVTVLEIFCYLYARKQLLHLVTTLIAIVNCMENRGPKVRIDAPEN